MDRTATVVVSVGLGLGVAGVLGPLVATWSTLPDTTQAALLACGPLAAAGLAVAGTRWGVRAPVGLLVTAVAASVARRP